MVQITVNTGRGKKRYASFQEFADASGIPYQTLYQRIQKGWSKNKAFTTPVRRKRKSRKH